MTERLIFTNTKLVVSGKKGIIRPTADGYYEFPIGAFNCQNSAGEVYTNDNIDNIFSKSGSFMRKIDSGKLFGEYGHPLPFPGEAENDYMARASSINDKDTCVFFKEVWNDPKVGHLFRGCRGIDDSSIITFALLKPHGNKWETLQRAIDDPNVNIAFSLRNFGRDRIYRGKTYVSIEQIITWDAVGDQGVGCAQKQSALKLESHKVEITPRLVEKLRNNLSTGAIRMENVDTIRSIIATADNYFSAKTSNHSYSDWR